ncbi:MAG: cytochrome C [Thermoanaerobaculia bacterium]
MARFFSPAKFFAGLIRAVSRHPLSAFGAAIVTASGTLLVSLLVLELAGWPAGPYMGLITLLVLPAFFLVGLALIPVGIQLDRRRRARAAAEGQEPPALPVIDFNRPRTRNLMLGLVALTATNVVILSAVTFRGLKTMESREFCANACHTVMEPEGTAHLRFAHAQVPCVGCHIGPGASSFLKAKLNGTRQLALVTFGGYHRPVPVPVEGFRKASEICSECHSVDATFKADRLKVIEKFAEDEANTSTKTVLLLRHTIHWHARPDVQIRFETNASRDKVGAIEVTTADGKVKRFKAPEATAAELKGAAWRTMDCLDCHNRPAHTFRTAEKELDLAFSQGRLDRSLPSLRQEGMKLITAEYPSAAAAHQTIGTELATFYREKYPDKAAEQAAKIQEAAKELGDLWAANVFPAMKVSWGTYPTHLGHDSSPGCFRCHDDEHATEDGTTLSQDCSFCHGVGAMDEEKPEVLEQLGR